MSTRSIFTTAILAIATLTAAHAQTPTDVYNFAGTTGNDVANPQPYGVMAQGRDGNLYSATEYGGFYGLGGTFMVMPSGAETRTYSFTSSAAFECQPGVNLGNDGNFYGACDGGSSGHGTLYKVTPTGTFTLLHTFTGPPDGAGPISSPIQATDGNFYGTTINGGANNVGTVYKLTPSSGTVKILYSFSDSGTDPYSPFAPFVQGTNGSLYGSASYGGASNCGAIFSITTAGKLKVLHSFTCTDGNMPVAPMIQGADGKFHGTTYYGGANNDGVVFEMTAAGALTVQHSFSGTDGQWGDVALVQATDGNFYGVSFVGGTAGGYGNDGQGTIYKVTAKGVFSTLYLFDGTVGNNPAAGLFQNTNGLLYGDTYFDDDNPASYGLFYSLDIGAKPFARLAATSGIEGTSIGIFGQGFSTATDVTFGGVSSSFTTAGNNYLTATVPADALTGSVVVKIPSGNLTSNKTFKVTPTQTTFSPPSGPVGTPVVITGTGLTQTTLVKFGTVTATSFIVNSDTQVTADVPTGAITATIHITTKGGTAVSKTKFTVN